MSRPFSSLLASKGRASPAMRRPAAGLAPTRDSLDDLGWNDMGDAPIASIARIMAAPIAMGAVPTVISERRLLAECIKRQAVPRTDRVAFTLRLDADRHLKLRLACAVDRRSAQQIVTEALDTFLADMPEVDMLAAKLARTDGKN